MRKLLFMFACLAGAATAQPAAEQPKAPDYNKRVNPDALSNAGSSLQNLDTIRDRNLGVAQKSGCPPEIAARIADLKWKLELGRSARGAERGAKAGEQGERAKAKPSGYASVASDWFKNESNGPGPSASNLDTLDSVLPGASSSAAETRAVESAPRSSESLETEIQKLEAACVARR